MFGTTKPEEKYYYYYPGYNDTRAHRRRVLAGYFDGKQIHIAQAVVFPGRKASLVVTKNGFAIDYGMPADSFNKKEGRYIASVRARGGFWDNDVITNTWVFQPRKQTTILTLDVPEGTIAVGKLFVEAVEAYLAEKGFPAKPVKEKAPGHDQKA